MRPTVPDHATKSLLTQLTLASLGLRYWRFAHRRSVDRGYPLFRIGVGRRGWMVWHDECRSGRLWRKRSGGQVQHLEPAKAEQPKGSLAIALLSSNGCFCSSRCNQLMSSEHQKDRTRRRRAPCARRTSPWPCSTVTPHSNQGRGKLYAGFVTLSDRAKAATSGDGAVANWRISISVRLVYRRFASSNDEHVKQLVVACVMFPRLRPPRWQPC